MNEPYYDFDEDWALVYASFQSEYGIRLSRDLPGMTWREFTYLCNGLSAESPLGRIVGIRSETDPERIKDFPPEAKRIRNEYLAKKAKKKPQKTVSEALEGFKSAFIKMAR